MTAALASSPEAIRDHGRALVVAAEDRAHDLATLAASRSADLELADRLFSELVDQPDLPDPQPCDGPTSAWNRESARRELRAREDAELARAEQRRQRRRDYRDARVDLVDVDTAAVMRLADGQLSWRHSTYAERVVAVDYCRTTLGLSLVGTAKRLGVCRDTVKQMRRHARVLRDSHGERR